jgi:hypothetical protein
MSFDAFHNPRIDFLVFAVKRDGDFAGFGGVVELAVAAAAGFDFIPAVIGDEFDDLAGVRGFSGWLAGLVGGRGVFSRCERKCGANGCQHRVAEKLRVGPSAAAG